MIKKCLFYSSIAIVVLFIGQGFKPLNCEQDGWFFINRENHEPHILPSIHETDYPKSDTPFTGKSFTGFKEALGFKESQGKYNMVNTFGYMGKYQFGSSSLHAVGIKDSIRFLNSPQLQEKAFISLLTINKKELRSEIENFDGKQLNGIDITESGILAAAHLGGVSSVKKFFKSNGKKVKKDAFGTSIITYMKKFSGYDTSFISSEKAK